ncbi:MAG: hypothetical protein ACI4MB_02695 [Candidatus Coproplasma sp.]
MKNFYSIKLFRHFVTPSLFFREGESKELIYKKYPPISDGIATPTKVGYFRYASCHCKQWGAMTR